MSRRWMCILYIALGVAPCFAQNSGDILAEALKNMPEEQRLPFLEAVQLYSKDNVDAAVGKLQPIVDSGHANVNVSALLGSILSQAKQWKGAAQAYQAALDAAGPSSNSFPWNLQQGLGEAFLALQRYPEAAHHLELSLPFRGNEEAYELYEEAGRAYEGAGEPALAIQAYADAVCIHPFDDQAWRALNRANHTRGSGSMHWSTRLTVPPKQVRFEDVAMVAQSVASGGPLSNDGRYAYVRIADSMYQADQVKWGGRFLRAAFRDYLDREWPEAEIRLNVEKTMALMDSFGYLPLLTPGTRYHLLTLLASDQTDKAEYGPALATFSLISHLALTAEQKADVNDLLRSYYRELFAAISFDLATGRPRSADPDDFLGPCMDELAEAKSDKPPVQKDKAEIPARDEKGNCLVKYGTLNPSEDQASTFGDLASGQDFMGPLPQILHRLIQQQKFNVLVKLALIRLPGGDTQDIESGNIAGVALADLDKAIASAPPGQVDEITMQAFKAAKESPRLFNIFVVKPTPKASRPKS